jgi:hypothetical protein
MNIEEVNGELERFIGRSENSELMRVVVVFEKVPTNMSIGVNVKVGSG